MSTQWQDPQQRAAGVLYETAGGDWVTPSDVPPPGRQRQPLAESREIHGQRIVICGPAGYEYGLHAYGDPVLGRDIAVDPPLRGKEAAQAFIAVVPWDVWSRYRFERRELQDGDYRWIPLYACWLDPWTPANA